jgi:hypothetical protein
MRREIRRDGRQKAVEYVVRENVTRFVTWLVAKIDKMKMACVGNALSR